MQNIQTQASFEIQPSKLHQKLVTWLIDWFFVKVLVGLIIATMGLAFTSDLMSDTNKSTNDLATILIIASAFAILKVGVDIQEKYYKTIVGRPDSLIAEDNYFPQMYSELHATLYQLAGSSGTSMLRSALHHLVGERHLDLANARAEAYDLIMEQSLTGLVQFESKGTTEYVFDSFRPKRRIERLPQTAQKYISLHYGHLILTNPSVFDEEYLSKLHPGLAPLVLTMTSLEYSHEELISRAQLLVNSIACPLHEVEGLPSNIV